VRPPQDPRTEIPPNEGDQPKGTGSLLGHDEEDPDNVKGLEDMDLPYIIEKPIERAEYLRLVRDMGDKFEKEFVLAFAMERDTRAVYGLEIKNIAPGSIFAAHGLLKGDVILSINDEPVRSIDELTLIARSNIFREEVRIDIERETGVVTFVFKPGVPD
jgi:membrane-associated protease RseP (regulator of RpoE activity)